jgi:hypothetical protein
MKSSSALFQLLLFMGLVLSAMTAQAQVYKVNGTVYDAETRECLIGATVYTSNHLKASTTNNYGYFSLGVQASDTLLVSFVGYRTFKLPGIASDTTLMLMLNPTNKELGEVNVVSAHVGRASNGMAFLSSKEIEKIPAILGERDVLKGFQTMPGVQGTTEGTSNMVVRGGSPDQTLILLDGIPVYNVNHLFGVFSVFNGDAINSAALYKGYMPPMYGGRLSAVLDIATKDGNNEALHGSGSIGLISSKLMLEGPVVKDKSSFLISARRTYIDLLARPIIKSAADGAVVGYNFYDVNAKFNHRFNASNRLFVSFYSGRDKYHSDLDETKELEGEDYTVVAKDKLYWGNNTALVRWNWIPNPQTFSNLSVSTSTYRMGNSTYQRVEYKDEDELMTELDEQSFTSEIFDFTSKWNVETTVFNKLSLKSGIQNSLYKFSPGKQGAVLSGLSNFSSSTNASNSKTLWGNETSAYFDLQYKLLPKLTAQTGLRAVLFSTQGSPYYGAEPRVNLAYAINPRNSFELSYVRTFQSLQLLTSSTLGLPTDFWAPSMPTVKPSTGNQVAASFSTRSIQNYRLSVEGYYKQQFNLVEYKDDAPYRYEGKQWYDKVEQGNGHSYGAELMLEKTEGKFTGWVAYTYSRSLRKFPTVNRGLEFPYKYDRPHYLNIVAFYKKSDRKDYGFNWVFASGSRTTLVSEKHELAVNDYDDIFVGESGSGSGVFFPQRNGVQLPFYHRLDLSVNWHKQKAKYLRTWSFGLYNAYWMRNPWYVSGASDGFWGISILPIVPNFSYSVQF